MASQTDRLSNTLDSLLTNQQVLAIAESTRLVGFHRSSSPVDQGAHESFI